MERTRSGDHATTAAAAGVGCAVRGGVCGVVVVGVDAPRGRRWAGRTRRGGRPRGPRAAGAGRRGGGRGRGRRRGRGCTGAGPGRRCGRRSAGPRRAPCRWQRPRDGTAASRVRARGATRMPVTSKRRLQWPRALSSRDTRIAAPLIPLPRARARARFDDSGRVGGARRGMKGGGRISGGFERGARGGEGDGDWNQMGMGDGKAGTSGGQAGGRRGVWAGGDPRVAASRRRRRVRRAGASRSCGRRPHPRAAHAAGARRRRERLPPAAAAKYQAAYQIRPSVTYPARPRLSGSPRAAAALRHWGRRPPATGAGMCSARAGGGPGGW